VLDTTTADGCPGGREEFSGGDAVELTGRSVMLLRRVELTARSVVLFRRVELTARSVVLLRRVDR
jgi:hypothetical protein